MDCPYCESERVYVKSSRSKGACVTRYRYCESCGKNFVTVEIPKEKYKIIMQVKGLLEKTT